MRRSKCLEEKKSDNFKLIRLPDDERGGLSIMSKSGGLNERAVAGKPSVTKFTHNNCTGIRASGTPRAAARKIETTIYRFLKS